MTLLNLLHLLAALTIGLAVFVSMVGIYQRRNERREYRRIMRERYPGIGNRTCQVIVRKLGLVERMLAARVARYKARKARKAREQWVAWING